MSRELRDLLEFLQTPAARAVYLVAAALIMALVARFVISVWRDRDKDAGTASDHLTNFRELHQRGVLDDGEFRTIRTVLGGQLRDELKQDGENS